MIIIIEFSTTELADSLPVDSEPPQVSWTLISILTDILSTVVWMVSTRPFISK